MAPLTKQELYEWFASRPIHFPADHRLLEVFLIGNFDATSGLAKMTKAEIRRSTGFSKYLVNKYVDGLVASGTWAVNREGNSHIYSFSPLLQTAKN